MATVPLYVSIGSSLRPGSTYTATGGVSTFTISGIASVSTATVITLGTTSHGIANNTPGIVTISGVGGADAAEANKEWPLSFFLSPNQVVIALDSSALTLTASGTCVVNQATITPYSAQWAGNSSRYNWTSRIEGVSDGGIQTYRFAGAPDSDAWAPYIWNHDGPASKPTISTITTGSVTTLTLSTAHGRTAGNTSEILVSGVTGTDADSLNGTWEATFRSTDQVEVALDSTSLTLTTTGSVRIPRFDYFSDIVTAANSYQVTTQTDRTNGGSATALSYDARSWGVTTSLCADLHDYHGALGERAYVLECSNVAPVLGRVPRTITAVTTGAWTRLTVASHQVPQDTGKPFPITLWGFTGDHTDLNGQLSAYYIDSETIEIRSVDSSAFGSYAGGAQTVTDQRWVEGYGEAWTDFENRLSDAIQAIEDAGDTAECKGIVSTIGYVDIPTAKADTAAVRVSGFRVDSVTTTGYPTTVTLSDSIPYTEAAAAVALRYVKLSGAGGLSGLYECRINSATEIVLHVSNALPIPTGAQVEIGDPIYFLRDEVTTLFSAVRTEIAGHTGQTATAIPLAIVDPIVLTAEQWDGTDAWTTATIYDQWTGATSVAVDPATEIQKVDTSGMTMLSTTSISTADAVALGHRIYDKWAAMRAATPSATTMGIPVYMMLGDSYCNGANSYLDAATGGDPRFDGSDYASEVSAGTRRIKIWNHSTQTLEDYGAVRKVGGVQELGNSVTHPILNIQGDGTATTAIIGPDQTFALEARAAHPDAPFVVVFKLGVSGSTLLGGTSSYVIDSVAADPDDSDYAIVTVAAGGYGRYQVSSFAVTFSGMDDAGISGVTDGVSYTATFRTLTEFRIYHGGTVSGSYAGGASVAVPRWRWDKDSADIWPYLTDEWGNCKAAIEAAGYYPDVRGVAIPGLGLNDALAGNATSGFQAAYTDLVTDVRDLATTRSSPSPLLPFAASNLKTHTYNSGDATVATAVTAIQTAIDAAASADSGLAVHSLDAADGNESDLKRFPINSDNVHLSGDGILEQGRELWDTLQTVDQSCANTTNTASSSSSDSIEAVS